MPRLARTVSGALSLLAGNNDAKFAFRPIMRRANWDAGAVAVSAYQIGIRNWDARVSSEMASWIYQARFGANDEGFSLDIVSESGFSFFGVASGLNNTDDFFAQNPGLSRNGLDAIAVRNKW